MGDSEHFNAMAHVALFLKSMLKAHPTFLEFLVQADDDQRRSVHLLAKAFTAYEISADREPSDRRLIELVDGPLLPYLAAWSIDVDNSADDHHSWRHIWDAWREYAGLLGEP